MGALGRVAIPVLAVTAVLWQCGRAELPPYLLTVGELDGLLGDIGRASAVLVPAADGWATTTASIVTDGHGRAALLCIRGRAARRPPRPTSSSTPSPNDTTARCARPARPVTAS